MTKPGPRFIRLPAADRRSALIEAALACMAEGGISAFTVDRVCRKAVVSRGLITHHFGSMAGLLTAVYAKIYAQAIPNAQDLQIGQNRLMALIDALFDPAQFNRAALNLWLTLWGAIANTPELAEEHRRQYAGYLGMVTETLAEHATAMDRVIDSRTLAKSLICFVDGLGLQHCIDPASMPAILARQACLDLLTPHLGPL